MPLGRTKLVADLDNSYEALPPNFSLSANMLAGAFAGIAVRSPKTTSPWWMHTR